MRVIFFGMECLYSRQSLAALLENGIDLRAVVVPRSSPRADSGPPIRRLEASPRAVPRRPLRMAKVEVGVVELSLTAEIPVYEIGAMTDERAVATLRDYHPDVIAVACFPRLLPADMLRLPYHGALNVHPSLLPAYRGPQPLFWIFHDGLEQAGVTVHFMDSRADCGDIVARRPLLRLPDGISYASAELLCADEGARMLVQAIRHLGAGTATRCPQPETGASYAPTPRLEDFVVTSAWSARRAFNFMRGMAHSGCPIRLRVSDEVMLVRRAFGYDRDGTPGAPVERAGNRVRFRFSDGVVLCEVAQP